MADKQLTAVAIDGHRLGINHCNINCEIDKDFSILLPLQVVHKIKSFLYEDIETDININVTSTSLIIDCGNKKAVFYLMNQDFAFPSYDHLIPKDNENIVTYDALYFANILKRVISISNESIKSVRIELNKNEVIIHTKELSDNYNNISREVIQYDDKFNYKGESMELALNSNYLIQFLTKVKDSSVSMYIKNSQNAVLLKCGKYLKYIVMPLKI